MSTFEIDLNTGELLPTKAMLKWKGSSWDIVELVGKPYHEVELAKQHFKRIAQDYEALTMAERIDGGRAARYFACMHRDQLSDAILHVVGEIEARFEATGRISGDDLGIVRRCYWQRNSWKADWKHPEEPYLLKGDRPGREHYGASEKALMAPRTLERVQNYLNNMRRLALNAEVRETVQDIEDQFIREGSLTPKQVDTLHSCSLRSNGRLSARDMGLWQASFQAVQG